MTAVSVFGGGAFGTSLAIALAADGSRVTLWSRGVDDASTMQSTRKSGRRLPGHDLPPTLRVTSDLVEARADVSLLAVPMQKLRAFLRETDLDGGKLVACCKGVDLATGRGPVETIEAEIANASAGILTGPSFADDIAGGLPTALTLAAATDDVAASLQKVLARPLLRLYRTDDVVGAELGGAFKNVVALAAGMAIGAGFGDSARASVIARGFAEMTRFAAAKGARAETLQGLSGLGDLVLTCTSEKSRNFMAGQRLGAGESTGHQTIEGIPTAAAIAAKAEREGVDMPITQAVADVTAGSIDVHDAVEALLARPTRKE